MKTQMPMLSNSRYGGRLICTVFEEMRECLKSLNFAYFNSLIEEAQMLANRMEDSLYDKENYNKLTEDIKKLKDAKKKLKVEVQELIDNRDALE